MATNYHSERTRIERFIDDAVTRIKVGASRQDGPAVYRGATDLAQSVDELLTLVGADTVGGGDDCPDCGQYIPDAIDILAEGEGLDRDEYGLTDCEQDYLDSRGEL